MATTTIKSLNVWMALAVAVQNHGSRIVVFERVDRFTDFYGEVLMARSRGPKPFPLMVLDAGDEFPQIGVLLLADDGRVATDEIVSWIDKDKESFPVVGCQLLSARDVPELHDVPDGQKPQMFVIGSDRCMAAVFTAVHEAVREIARRQEGAKRA